MGVKSTYSLTRRKAEDKYVELKMESQKSQRMFRAQAVMMEDKELEDELERLNDENHNGEGFENYSINDYSCGD